MMMDADAAESTKNKNHVERFEEAFQNVCKYLDKMDEKKIPPEDVRKEADILMTSFLDAGRSCEQFFMQKHIQIADARPDQILREECSELQSEIQKKDRAIMKHHDKLKMWQQELRGGLPRPQMVTRPGTQPQSAAASRAGQVPNPYANQGQQPLSTPSSGNR